MVTCDGTELTAIPWQGGVVQGYYASRCGWIWSTWLRRPGSCVYDPDAKEPTRLVCPIVRRYRHVILWSAAKQVLQGAVHRLVLLTFKGLPPEGKPQAAHENGDSLDNRIENLNWKSAKENCHDRYRHGTIGHLRGEQVAHKLTEAEVLDIRRRYATGGVTQKTLAVEKGLHQVTVSEIVTRKIWSHI